MIGKEIDMFWVALAFFIMFLIAKDTLTKVIYTQQVSYYFTGNGASGFGTATFDSTDKVADYKQMKMSLEKKKEGTDVLVLAASTIKTRRVIAPLWVDFEDIP